MTVQDYLLKFRKISGKYIEPFIGGGALFFALSPDKAIIADSNPELINMYRAADHRRAELVSGGRLFDLGQVPKSVWHYVQ